MYIYHGKKLDISDAVLANLFKNTGIPISDETIDVLVSNALDIYPNDERFHQISEKDIENVIKEAARPVSGMFARSEEPGECDEPADA